MSIALALERVVFVLAGACILANGIAIAANFRHWADMMTADASPEMVEQYVHYYAGTRPIMQRIGGVFIAVIGAAIFGFGGFWGSVETIWGGVYFGSLAVIFVGTILVGVAVENVLGWKRRKELRERRR